MLRSRPSRPDPLVAARVEQLLGVPVGGWVPPPSVALPEAEEAQRVAGGATAGALEEVQDLGMDARQAGVAGSEGAEVVDLDEIAGEDDAEDLQEAAGERRDRGSEPASRRPHSRLPGTLAGGRLDPGRRGVLALLLVALVAAAAAGAVALRGRPQEVALPAVVAGGEPLPGTAPSAAPPPQSPEPGGEVVVAVAGEVRSPGVVRLPAGSRVDDAVRAAGGAAPGASYGLLNLARRLVDGEQVLVGVDPPPGAQVVPPAAASGSGLVDLNSATAGDLDGLPGIGPVLAQRIVDWRASHGRFESVDQLREVTGIGESRYADLKDKVTVG